MVGRPAKTIGIVAGFWCLVRGVGFVARRPRLWLFGLLPALLTFVVLAGLLVWLGVSATELASWLTPFAVGWSPAWRDLARVVLAVSIMVVAVLAAVLLFVSLTLVIGQPFYDQISRRVDAELGGLPPEAAERWYAGVWRSLVESLAMLARTLPAGLLVFAVSLIPAVGQVAGPVLGALVGGRFLALELLTPAMERRGQHLAGRLALARAHRAAVYGFGVPTFVVFLVPLLAVVVMPGAVAGATMLAREMGDIRELATDR